MDSNNCRFLFFDMLAANRNISSLLVRAFLSTNQAERDIAVQWMRQVMSSGPPRNRRQTKGAPSMEEVLRRIAIINVWLGYFWTAPLIESLTETHVTDPQLLRSQKALLMFMADKL